MADAVRVVRKLRYTFSSGRTRSYEWRIAQLKQVWKLVDENEDQIIEALSEDIGKPPFESFFAEISLTKDSCKVAIKQLKSWMAPEKVSTTLTVFPSKAEILPEPLGAALIISAWNYPLLLSMDPVIGAIAAGNVIVLKPSEVAPATSSLLATLIPQYLDDDAIRVVEGSVAETTSLLEQKWDKIFYTGSGKIGRIVMAAAAKHLTPVTLELGGKCPVIVDPTVDLEVTARRIVAGKWGCNNGQACIAPDYIITPESFAPKLIDALKNTLEKFYGQDPIQSADLSRIVNSSHFVRLTRLLDDPKVSDKVIYGGQRDEKRLIIAPTLVLDAPMDSLIMIEEIFGPLLTIITVQKMEEALEVVSSFSKPLAAYVFTKNKKFERQVVASVSAGGMLVNDTALHVTNHHLPFGGVGESGVGSYHGKFSFEAFSHKKAVLYRGFMGDLMARYPPYTTRKQKIVRCLLSGDFLGLLYAILGWNSK
uniref:Aldehyde dehydrogenase n=1 Tax=Picea sitchensis TaxID=3332 RepID=A9NUC8_PICSI|nr:unknown [Picea sitchensis]